MIDIDLENNSVREIDIRERFWNETDRFSVRCKRLIGKNVYHYHGHEDDLCEDCKKEFTEIVERYAEKAYKKFIK